MMNVMVINNHSQQALSGKTGFNHNFFPIDSKILVAIKEPQTGDYSELPICPT